MDIGEIQRVWEVEPMALPAELPDPEPVPTG